MEEKDLRQMSGKGTKSRDTIPLSLQTQAFCFVFEFCGHGSCGPDSSTHNYGSTAVIRALHEQLRCRKLDLVTPEN
ncbi:hypothetical protein Anapl_09771 [Anas platyrhynchos]|uniref:Uncharacterized protein n=1 Tax=Anas platyrhynchos TaxID=8839 RepID=R0L8B3_ANAPL|nr:hypothetical protein Anapl_09771 [Anas platyrhynchos]